MIKLKKIIYLLLFLNCTFLSCSENTTASNIHFESCLKSLDTLGIQQKETIGCAGRLLYQFVNDSTALVIELSKMLLQEEENCEQFDLVKDSLFVGVYLYSFINLTSESIIQMPLCTDIIITNAVQPAIEKLVIQKGELRLYRNSKCQWSFLLEADLQSQRYGKFKNFKASSWRTDICSFPG